MANLDALYTGTNAPADTFGNEEATEATEEAISEQQHQIAELMPSVQAILDGIDAEVAAVSDIRAYMSTLGAKPSKDAIETEYRARELYIGYLGRLKTQIESQVLTAKESVNGQ